MKLALIEDDLEQLHLLQTMVSKALTAGGVYDGQVDCFSGSADFLAVWCAGCYDIILLDIFVDSLSGVEIAQKIRETDPEVALVFCTSSNEFAAQSYEVNARYYLLKPITPEKLNVMFQRLDLEKLEAARSIQLPDGYRFLLRKLIYTNYVNHLVTFYIQDEEPHSIYTTQAEVERLLHQSFFYSVNKGSIINLYMVKRVTPDSFVMKDGSTVPIARRRYKEAKEAYTHFRFHKLSEEVDQG